jgi:hypothetical protein
MKSSKNSSIKTLGRQLGTLKCKKHFSLSFMQSDSKSGVHAPQTSCQHK